VIDDHRRLGKPADHVLGLPELRFLVLGGETQQDIGEDLRSIGLPVPKGSLSEPG